MSFYIYYTIFTALMPWRCHEVGDFPNTWKVLGSKQRKLKGFFINFIPGHKAGPIIQKAARACEHGCKLLWFQYWEKVAGTRMGDEIWSRGCPSAQLIQLHCVDLNTELSSQLSVWKQARATPVRSWVSGARYSCAPSSGCMWDSV